MIERHIGRERIGFAIEERFIGVFCSQVFVPPGGFSQPVVLVKEIDCVTKKIPMRLEDVVVVFLILFRGLLIGGADFGDNVEVGAELERFGKRIGH